MAEVMEHEYATKAKANAALATGIIGTSLAGLLALNRPGGLCGILVGGRNRLPKRNARFLELAEAIKMR